MTDRFITLNRADASDRVCPNRAGGTNSPENKEKSTKKKKFTLFIDEHDKEP